MPKTPSRGKPGDDLPVGVRNALAATLEPDERIERHVPVVGAHLILTDRRLFVVRHGYDYRPATGIRGWPLDRHLQLRIEPGHLQVEARGTRVIVLYHAPQAVTIRSLVAAARRIAGPQ